MPNKRKHFPIQSFLVKILLQCVGRTQIQARVNYMGNTSRTYARAPHIMVNNGSRRLGLNRDKRHWLGRLGISNNSNRFIVMVASLNNVARMVAIVAELFVKVFATIA